MGNVSVKNLEDLNKPYDKLYDFISNHDKRYLDIYDLRTGRVAWKLDIRIIQKELSFKFHLLENSKMVLSIPLRASHDSTDYQLFLKSKTWSDCIKIELYADNIHCHKLSNINLPILPIVYGFLTYDGQTPIPIAI